MKFVVISFLLFFILSILGVIIFPHSVMVLCNENSMCEMVIHQIDKALNLFRGIFPISFYFILILVNISLVIFLIFLIDKSKYIRNKFFDCPNSVFLDYLKKLLSRGILEPQLYS